MASIFIVINGKKWKVICSDLIPLVKANYPAENRKSQWAYSELSNLVKHIPRNVLIDFINVNTDSEISVEDSIVDVTLDNSAADTLVGKTQRQDPPQSQNQETAPTPFVYNDYGTLKNVHVLNIPALTEAFKTLYQLPYNFATIEHARKQLSKLEKDRSEKLKESTRLKPQNLSKMASVSTQPINWEQPKYNASLEPEDYVQKIQNMAKVGKWDDGYTVGIAVMGLTGNADLWYKTTGKK